MTSGSSAEADVRAAMADFDRAFAAGDADALVATCTEDARFLLLYSPARDGQAAIRAAWTAFFAAYDTTAWVTDRLIVDVHGDRAYTVSTYSETLVPRGGGTASSIEGRLVLFLRRASGGPWLVTLALNSHIRPVVPVEPP